MVIPGKDDTRIARTGSGLGKVVPMNLHCTISLNVQTQYGIQVAIAPTWTSPTFANFLLEPFHVVLLCLHFYRRPTSISTGMSLIVDPANILAMFTDESRFDKAAPDASFYNITAIFSVSSY